MLKMYKSLYSDMIHGVITEDVFSETSVPLKEFLLNLDATIILDLNREEILNQIASINKSKSVV